MFECRAAMEIGMEIVMLSDGDWLFCDDSWHLRLTLEKYAMMPYVKSFHNWDFSSKDKIY